MSEEISIEHHGETITASYTVFEDTLHVYLPDGSTRVTELRGLDSESSARMHLKMYVKRS
ncbi:hypothetical protein TUM4438_14680 [Shewanella sairae]|uniref:Lipocalin-like domain-containing protein n=1 Tax=Shewanella sairae TaxID=190310 RepID=A0ABQ4P9M8_9GAMM|nr:hypothetical protein [Shewanella sairae]MCL1128999.1 hypothetical protein [Shewanella sairae]GIU44143.1 hypothetical protein TUM4438_14680 [Shewanella sairae]